MNIDTLPNHRYSAGFSLVELMISLLLGLMVTTAVIAVFISNKTSYQQNELISRMQESARFTYETLSRELRQTGGISCGHHIKLSNVLNTSATQWWSKWEDDTLIGYDGSDTSFPKSIGTGNGERVSGTDAIILRTATATPLHRIISHDAATKQIEVSNNIQSLATGDVAVACDFEQAAIFQITATDSSNNTIGYGGGSSTPGNCSTQLGYPFNCGSGSNPTKTFAANGVLSKLNVSGWYIGHNGRGGSSLYRISLENSSGTPTAVTEEIAEGAVDIQFEYLLQSAGGTVGNSYVEASGVTDWSEVIAVRMVLSLQTLEGVGSPPAPATRTWYSVMTLRNRLS